MELVRQTIIYNLFNTAYCKINQRLYYFTILQFRLEALNCPSLKIFLIVFALFLSIFFFVTPHNAINQSSSSRKSVMKLNQIISTTLSNFLPFLSPPRFCIYYYQVVYKKQISYIEFVNDFSQHFILCYFIPVRKLIRITHPHMFIVFGIKFLFVILYNFV